MTFCLARKALPSIENNRHSCVWYCRSSKLGSDCCYTSLITSDFMIMMHDYDQDFMGAGSEKEECLARPNDFPFQN